MKLKSLITAAALAAGLALPARAADEHHHRIKAGPTGGRLITEVEPHAEFLVNKDKKVEIRFVNDADKVIAPGGQVVSAIIGERGSPTRMTFTQVGDKLVSDKVVPSGNNHPTVVQFREKAGAKATNAKFNLNLTQCPECSHPEYACTCDHDHDHGDEAPKKPAKKK